jgi:SAM-dependent methyltransferase
MQTLFTYYGKQLARPHGLLGSWLMSPLIAHGNRALNHWTVRTLAIQPGERVLDVGCGAGMGLARVASGGATAVGVDISPVMLRAARRRLGRRGHIGHANANDLPYAEGLFDAAYAVNVLYFWPDAIATLREIRRVLRPGGRLMLGLRPEALVRQLRFEEIGFQAYSPDHVAQVLEAAGFSEVAIAYQPSGSYLPGWGASARR